MANALRRLDLTTQRLLGAAARSPVLQRVRRLAGRGGPILLLVVAGGVLWHEFRGLTPALVLKEALGWGAWRTAGAFGLTAISFVILGLIERLGLRWAGIKAPWRAAFLGAFCANAFAHAIGFALLVGGAVRVRLYARHGCSILQATQATAFYGVAFGAGMATLGGFALLANPVSAVGERMTSQTVVQALALTLLAAPALYVALCARVRGQGTFLGHSMSLPPPLIATVQVMLGLVDCTATAGVVWLLLPRESLSFAGLVSGYVPATLLGLISHVPAGAGVFESTVLALLPDMPRATLAAAFLGYRLIYYLVPLGAAMLLVARFGMARSETRPKAEDPGPDRA